MGWIASERGDCRYTGKRWGATDYENFTRAKQWVDVVGAEIAESLSQNLKGAGKGDISLSCPCETVGEGPVFESEDGTAVTDSESFGGGSLGC